MAQQQYQQVTVPGEGNFFFPSSMSDDDIKGALYEHFPHLKAADPDATKSFKLGQALDSFMPKATTPTTTKSPTTSIVDDLGKIPDTPRGRKVAAFRQSLKTGQGALASDPIASPLPFGGGFSPSTVNTHLETPNALSGVMSTAEYQAAQQRHAYLLSHGQELKEQGVDVDSELKDIEGKAALTRAKGGGTPEDQQRESVNQWANEPKLNYLLALPHLLGGGGLSPEQAQEGLDAAHQFLAPKSRTPGTLEPEVSPWAERAKAVGRTALGTEEGLTTPVNMALMGSMMLAPELAGPKYAAEVANLGRVAGAGFTAQMGTAGVKGIPTAVQKLQSGAPGEGLEASLNAASNLAMAALGAAHELHSFKASEGVEAAPTTAPVVAPPVTPTPQAPKPSSKHTVPPVPNSSLYDDTLVPTAVKATPPAAPVPPKISQSVPSAPKTAAEPYALPTDLKGSKPRYGYGDKNFELSFQDPRDLAAYTITQATKNKAHDRFTDYLKPYFETGQAAVAHGEKVRAAIKQMAAGADPSEGPLQIPRQYNAESMRGKIPAPAAVQTPAQTTPGTVGATEGVVGGGAPAPQTGSYETWKNSYNEALIKQGGVAHNSREALSRKMNMTESELESEWKNGTKPGVVANFVVTNSLPADASKYVTPEEIKKWGTPKLLQMIEERRVQTPSQPEPQQPTPQTEKPLPLTAEAKKNVANLILRRNANNLAPIDEKWVNDPTKVAQVKAVQQVADEVMGGRVNLNELNSTHIRALKNFVKTGKTVPEALEALRASKSTDERVLKPGAKEDLPTQEGKIRSLVNSVMRIRQLQQAAKDRLSVQLALREHALQERTKADIEDPDRQSDLDKVGSSLIAEVGHPIPAEHLEAVSRILGIEPDVIRDNNYRLSSEQVVKLNSALQEGKKAVPLSQDHPETAFGTHTIHPLSEINEESLRAAGVPSPKDRFATLTAKEKKEFNRQKEAGVYAPLVMDPHTGRVISEGASRQSIQAGLSKGAKQVSRGRDADTLELEHRYAQIGLERRLKQVRDELNERVPKWVEARRQAKDPSQLAQDVAQLSGTARKWLPRELYSHEHLIPKIAPATEGSLPEQPVPPTPRPKAESSTKGTSTKSKAVSDSDIQTGVSDVAQAIYDDHGEEAFNGIKPISDAIGAKFKGVKNFNSLLYSALNAYKKNLEAGIAEPTKPILEQLEKLPQETRTTLHANPIPEGGTKVTIPAPRKGPTPLSSDAMDKLVGGLEQQRGASFDENTKAFFDNETTRVADYLRSIPELTRDTLQHIRDISKQVWQAYSDRPGNTELDNALGWRRWELSVSALTLQKFTEQIRRLHPSKARREAMVNYLQARGGVEPEANVQAELQLKADSFAQRADNIKLKQGYLDAMNLTDKEKETLNLYRTYDADLTAREEALGLSVHRLEDYIRQIWTPESLAVKGIKGIIHSAPFGTNAAFEKMRKYESYFDGEMDGLTPLNKDLGFLIAARARSGATVIANRTLIDRLYAMKMDNGDAVARVAGVGYGDPELNPEPGAAKGAIIIKSNARTKDAVTSDTNEPYAMINHPAFSNWKWVKNIEWGLGDDGQPLSDVQALYKGNMLIHPDVATQLKRILEPSQVRASAAGRAVLKLSNVGKQTLLIGLFHPVQLGIHFLEHAGEGGTSSRTLGALNPFSKSVIDLDTYVQQQLVVHGLKIADYNAESMWSEGVMSHGLANSMPYFGAGLRAIHDAMFQKYIPNIKMAMALDAFDRNKARYAGDYQNKELANQRALGYENFAEAARKAESRVFRMTSDQMNAAFGGINWDKIPINKTWQDYLRLTVLAPDFLLARMQFVGDAFRPGGRESAKALLIGAFVQYTAARAFNMSMNDGDAKWSPKDWNKFVSGHKEYSLRTVQGDVTDAVFDWRRFVSHRLNPLFARPVMEGITGKDIYGHPTSAGQQLFDFAQNVVPMPLQGLYQAAESKLGQSTGWNVRRMRDTDDHIVDTIIQSMTGVQRHEYRSPAEKYVFNKFDNTKGNPSDDELSLEQRRTFNDLRDEYKKGNLNPDKLQEGILSGKLKSSELKYLGKTAKETQLKVRARFLPVGQVVQAWQLGTPMEKAQLTPLLFKKAKELGPDDRIKLITGLSDWLDTQSQDSQQKILQQVQDELEWEQEKLQK